MVKRKLSLYLSPVAQPTPSRSLFRFPLHEETKRITTPPWMGCKSIAGLPPSNCFPGNLPVPIYTPVWRGAL